MKPVLFIPALLLLSMVPRAVDAKGSSVGIYAIIDQMMIDQDTVRIAGAFVVPLPHSSGDYNNPQRGTLYFRIRLGGQSEARQEWSQLKAAAGTGRVIGFGYYWVPHDPGGNPHHSLEVKIRGAEDATPPDVYPLPIPAGQNVLDERIAADLRTYWLR